MEVSASVREGRSAIAPQTGPEHNGTQEDRFMWRLLAVLIPLSFLPAATPFYRLERQWQVTLPGSASRIAVCRDGAVYAWTRWSNFHGTILALDADGNTILRRDDPVLAAVYSMACTEDRLYTAGVVGPIRIFQRKPSLTIESAVQPEVQFDQMAVVGPDRIIVHALGDRSLAAIDGDGRLLLRSDGLARGRRQAFGSLILADVPRCILSLMPGSSEFQIFAPDGHYVTFKTLRMSGGSRTQGAWRTSGAVRLLNGTFVVQTAIPDMFHYWVTPTTVLQIFDLRLDFLTTTMSEPGGLMGATPQGDLYFVTRTGHQSILTKSRLIAPKLD